MGLRQELLDKPVSELELREALILQRTDKVSDAVKLMKEKKLGCVCVVDGDGRCTGTFTERHLINMLLVEGEKAFDEMLGENLSEAWSGVKLSDPIARVIDEMETFKLRFVVVVDDDGKPVSLTGQKGVAEYIVDHFPRQVKVQMMESKLYMDQREGG